MIKSDPKEFYRYTRSKTTIKSGVGPMRYGENITSDEVRTSEILSLQYKNMFSELKEDISTMNFDNLHCD